jgi:hypothetical protein
MALSRINSVEPRRTRRLAKKGAPRVEFAIHRLMKRATARAKNRGRPLIFASIRALRGFLLHGSGFAGRQFQLPQVPQRLVAVRAAHRVHGPQAHTHGGSLRTAEKRAAQIRQQLHARNPCRFAVGHPWYRGRNRWRDATGPAIRAAVHEGQVSSLEFGVLLAASGLEFEDSLEPPRSPSMLSRCPNA